MSAPRPRPGGRRYVALAVAAAAVPLTVLAVFFVVPVVGMLRLGFFPDGSFRKAPRVAKASKSQGSHTAMR